MTSRPQHRWLVPWLALCLACAPTEGDPPDETDGGATDAGATDGGVTDAGQPVGTTIGAAGGLVQFGNLVFVEIPAGALATDTDLTITPIEVTAPDGLTKVTGGFLFGPEGTTFAQPVSVTMVLNQAAPANVKLYWSKAGGASGFDALPTQLVAGGGAIKASVSHFSIGFGAGTLAATGACSPQEQYARDALAGYTPFASETGASARLLLLGAGTTRYLLSGGEGELPGTSGAMYTVDGRYYERVNPEGLMGSNTATGVGVDVPNGWIYEMVAAGNDLTIVRRKAGSCPETVGTIASAFPSGSGVLAVAANGDVFALAQLRDRRRVSFVGTNGGTTWAMKGEVSGDSGWYAPGSATRIHVSGGSSGSLARLSTSADGGATWTRSTVPSNTILTGTSYVHSLAFDPANASTIYAATTLGLYKSTDGGLTFPLPEVQLPNDRKPVQAAFASDGRLFVLAAPTLLNAGGLFVRAAGGTTFTPADGDLPAEDRQGTALAIKEEGGGVEIVRISGAGRVWRSLDGGATWTTGSAGLDGTRTFQVLTDPRNEQALYVGVQQHIFDFAPRLWHTTDGGATLTPIALPTRSHGSLAVLGDGTLFVLEVNSALGLGLRSTDNGATFTNSAGLNDLDGNSGSDMFGAAFTWTQNVFPDAAPTVAYYVNKVGSLWRTEDSAATWSALGPIAGTGIGVVALYASPATPRRLVAQVGNSGPPGLSLSTDGGTSWTDLAIPVGLEVLRNEGGFDAAGHLWLPARNPTTNEGKFLVLDPAATALVDRTTPGASYPLTILGHRVTAKDMRSTDGGVTWAALTPADRLADWPLTRTDAFVHRANPKRVIVQFGGLRTSLLP